MAFGPFNSYNRLGIANLNFPNAALWARAVLRLPAGPVPIYQGFLVHSTAMGGSAYGAYGPEAAEHTPGATADAEVDRADIVREVSIYDSRFAARNVSTATTPNPTFSLQTYSANRYNKLFYVNNEPDAYWPASDLPSLSNAIDNYTGINVNSFWEPTNPGLTTQRRIRADALALVFLRLKKDFGNSRGHIVLPPCPSGAISANLNAQPDSYWQPFFDAIHPLPAGSLPTSTITVGGQTEAQITPFELKALHLHYYSPPRGKPELPNNLPLETVAEGAYNLRNNVNWYRNRYVGANQPLPMDVLLSEFGFLWSILIGDNPKHKWLWAGGWDNFRDGLSWWNSWLCWVLRRAPIAAELNLAGSPNGNLTDSRAVYACAHETHQAPYTTFGTYEPINPLDPLLGNHWQIDYGTRNQFFYNCDTGASGVTYTAEFINVISMLPSGRFLPSFSSSVTAYWSDGYGNAQNFRLGPFGACYKVWAEVGADPVTGNLATGWINTTQANQGGTVSIYLQTGYNTVYIPIIKSQTGAYTPGTRFDVKWGSQEIPFGYGEMSEFPDSRVVNTIYTRNNSGQFGSLDISAQPQTVYSTMVFPVVCYTASPRTITIKVVRNNIGGTAFAIGRPIVIRGACSWLTNQ